jgi:hypothetical protein
MSFITSETLSANCWVICIPQYTIERLKYPKATEGISNHVQRLRLGSERDYRANHHIVEQPVSSWGQPVTETMIANVQKSKAYGTLREEWLGVSQVSKMEVLPSSYEPCERVKSSKRKIEALSQLLNGPVAASHGPWVSSVFEIIERPLHLARVAYDNKNIVMMEQIHNAIKLRWVNAHRRRQASGRVVADSINALFEQDHAQAR